MFTMWKRLFLMVALCLIIGPASPADDHDEAGDFCYEDPDCGPESDKWGGECKTGSHQSPIDLVPIGLPMRVSLSFNDGYALEDYWVRNNGHTVQVNLNQDPTSDGVMEGYGFERPYIFAQIHFHWGRDGGLGSEHTLRGMHFPMEVHLVHYDSQYSNFSEAAKSGDPTALGVLGVFLEEGSEEDENQAFDQISSHLALLYQPEPIHLSFPLDLTSFLPTQGDRVFRYLGSLTTPNCTEAVKWTMLESPMRVKPSEIARFRRVQNHNDRVMGINFRPVQPLGAGRTLEYLEVA